MEHIKQFLDTGVGTEGQLLIPRKIFDVLIPEVEKILIPRSEAAIFVGPSGIPGSSIDIDLVVENTMDVREIAEGSDIYLDNQEYTSFNLKPKKYGVTIRITRELMEDSKFELLRSNVAMAGRRLAENENSLVITDALDNADNTVVGGAAVTIANITRAMQHLEDADYTPTSFFVGNEMLNDLRNIDTFVEANKVGNTDMIQRGFQGTLYGLNVMRVSTNAGMTTTTGYVTDKSKAYVIAEKRPMSVENFELPSFDMSAAAVTQRIAIRHLRSAAIAKITTT